MRSRHPPDFLHVLPARPDALRAPLMLHALHQPTDPESLAYPALLTCLTYVWPRRFNALRPRSPVQTIWLDERMRLVCTHRDGDNLVALQDCGPDQGSAVTLKQWSRLRGDTAAAVLPYVRRHLELAPLAATPAVHARQAGRLERRA